MDKITKELKVSGIYCIENAINHKTYIGSSKKQNTKYKNYMQCRAIK